MRITGCILAGGRSSRMGTDKADVLLAGKPLLHHAIERLRPQVSTLIVNANKQMTYSDYPIVNDGISGQAGPLAGVLAALDWVSALPEKHDALVTVPVDAPFFPIDMAARLSAISNGTVCIARCANQLHPVFAFWPVGMSTQLRQWLQHDGNRSVQHFLQSIPHTVVDFAAPSDFDPFMNINTPDDLAKAERLLQVP